MTTSNSMPIISDWKIENKTVPSLDHWPGAGKVANIRTRSECDNMEEIFGSHGSMVPMPGSDISSPGYTSPAPMVRHTVATVLGQATSQERLVTTTGG